MIAGPLRQYLKHKRKKGKQPPRSSHQVRAGTWAWWEDARRKRVKRSMLQATRRVKAKQRSERECRRRFRCVGHSLIGSEERSRGCLSGTFHKCRVLCCVVLCCAVLRCAAPCCPFRHENREAHLSLYSVVLISTNKSNLDRT